MARPIGTLGTIPTLTVGGRVFTDLDNLIYVAANRGNANNRSSFRKPNASSGYQVPVGQTFTCHATRVQTASAISASGISLAYADNDVGYDSTTAATNPVFIHGTTSRVADNVYVNDDVSTIWHELAGPGFTVPAQKYPFAEGSTGFTFYLVMFGYAA